MRPPVFQDTTLTASNSPTGGTTWWIHRVITPSRPALTRLGGAFFIFGVINNALYVVILTAALELLPVGVPTGVVACANIAPSLVAKALFPYILTGTVRYARRIWACSIMSFIGLIVRVLPTKKQLKLHIDLLTSSRFPRSR